MSDKVGIRADGGRPGDPPRNEAAVPDSRQALTSEEIAEIERTFQFDSDAKAHTIMRLIADLRAQHDSRVREWRAEVGGRDEL